MAARRRRLYPRGDCRADGQDREFLEVSAGPGARTAAAPAGDGAAGAGGTMMHCPMDDLVALKAGEASVWARKHLDTCDACRAELEALYQRVAQLKALPSQRPGRDRWPAIRAELAGERQLRRRTYGA